MTESSRIRGSKANRGDSFLEGLSRVEVDCPWWPMTKQPSRPSPADSPPGMNSTQLSTSWVCSHHPTGHRQKVPRWRWRKLAPQELGCQARRRSQSRLLQPQGLPSVSSPVRTSHSAQGSQAPVRKEGDPQTRPV